MLLGLVASIVRAGRGWFGRWAFTPLDATIRQATTSLAQLQLLVGCTLYLVSPLVASFHLHKVEHDPATLFFGAQHAALMGLAVAILTIGAGLSKRQATARATFGTLLGWFTLALLLIGLAIPWPFSPFAQRPFFRL